MDSLRNSISDICQRYDGSLNKHYIDFPLRFAILGLEIAP
jgi:hypothetical protein